MSALMFGASIGMVLRTFADAVTALWRIPLWAVVVAFGLYCVAVAYAVTWVSCTRWLARRSVIQAWLIALSIVVLLITLLTSPEVDARADRDDALDIGVRELIAASDPWAATTQLGNHISPLLGGLVLALPFVVVLGSSAFQNVAWWVAGAQLGYRHIGPQEIAIVATVLMLSPVMLNELVYQSDLWINAVILAIAIIWGQRAACQSASLMRIAPSAILAALAWSDRYIFLVLLVPVAVWMLRTAAPHAAVRWLSTTAAVSALIYGVMALWFPASVTSAIANADKATSSSIPASGFLLAILSLGVALIASWRADSTRDYFWAMTLSLAVLPAWRALTLAIDDAAMTINDYSVVSYSAAFLIFGLLAVVAPSDSPMRTHAAPTPGLG